MKNYLLFFLISALPVFVSAQDEELRYAVGHDGSGKQEAQIISQPCFRRTDNRNYKPES